MPLHLDHRPTSLDEFIGNEKLKEALHNVLESSDRVHAFLFAGPPGCGKTTLAHIVAKRLGCSDIDFYHMNIANTTGVDDARELSANMHLRPMDGPVKVYLLDEVQKASGNFFDCMLNPLEFTPKHVVFILCTTNPEKLTPAILSRCMRFDVRQLREGEIRKLLQRVLEREKITDFPKETLTKISQNCNKTPRDALVLLNKVIDLPDYTKARDIVEALASKEDVFIQLVNGLLDKQPWNIIAPLLVKMQEAEPEHEKIRQGILSYCNKVLLGKDRFQAAVIIDEFKNDFFKSGHAGLTLACYKVVSDV